MSLPVWEEWIEILCTGVPCHASASLPVWEEWIEIACPITRAASAIVSSRMGRVD